MKKTLLVLVVLAVLAAGAGLNYHVILLDDDIRVLRKAEMGFSDTFVDARGINRVKLYSNPALVKAGVLKLFR